MKLAQLVDAAIHSITKGKYIAHGNDGIIYGINNDVILKLHNGGYHGTPRKSAEHEFGLGTELYQQGVQVPRYIDLFTVRLRNLECHGVFMERIHGADPFSLTPSLLPEAQRQYQEQKKLVEGLGYTMKDSHVYSNTLFDQKRRKLYLFDLVQWRKEKDNFLFVENHLNSRTSEFTCWTKEFVYDSTSAKISKKPL